MWYYVPKNSAIQTSISVTFTTTNYSQYKYTTLTSLREPPQGVKVSIYPSIYRHMKYIWAEHSSIKILMKHKYSE